MIQIEKNCYRKTCIQMKKKVKYNLHAAEKTQTY